MYPKTSEWVRMGAGTSEDFQKIARTSKSFAKDILKTMLLQVKQSLKVGDSEKLIVVVYLFGGDDARIDQ